MLKFTPKVFLAIICWGIFGYIILQVPYPQTLTQANIIQVISFFIPLFLALFFTINFLLNSYLYSAALAFSIISLLILAGLDTLNLVSAALTVISIVLLVSYFKKSKINKGLTSISKIPKLTKLQK